jgi:hypothetical protein
MFVQRSNNKNSHCSAKQQKSNGKRKSSATVSTTKNNIIKSKFGSKLNKNRHFLPTVSAANKKYSTSTTVSQQNCKIVSDGKKISFSLKTSEMGDKGG